MVVKVEVLAGLRPSEQPKMRRLLDAVSWTHNLTPLPMFPDLEPPC